MPNGYQGAQRWIDEYEKHELECQQIMIEAAAKCAPIKAMMSDVKKAAKESGIPIKVFAAALLERKHLKNAAKVRDKLEEYLADELDLLREALEPVKDLPLFGAALQAAEASPKKSKAQKKAEADKAAVDSLSGDEFDDADPAKQQVADNVTRLQTGIQPLN